MFCFAALAYLHTGREKTNGTGAFPLQSFCNKQYVFVVYVYNLNAIIVRTMPSKNKVVMIAAFTNILADLNAHGYACTLNIMDNECSKAIKAHIQNNHVEIHLIPPHNHRVNAAKCAIATFKEHFNPALAAVDRSCLLKLCTAAEMT
jgi:hypothetical protein